MLSFFFFDNILFFSVWQLWVFAVAYRIFSCSMWDLVSWPGIEPETPALGAQGLSHWTTREVPMLSSRGEEANGNPNRRTKLEIYFLNLENGMWNYVLKLWHICSRACSQYSWDPCSRVQYQEMQHMFMLWCSIFFTVQLSHLYMTTGKTARLLVQKCWECKGNSAYKQPWYFYFKAWS